MLNNFFKSIAIILLATTSLLVFADNQCSQMSDMEYQDIIVGQWKAVDGPDIKEMKKEGFEFRLKYTLDNKFEMSLGSIRNININYYTAYGTYTILDGKFFIHIQSESGVIELGLAGESFYEPIKCMGQNEYQDSEYTYKRIN